MNQPIYSPAQGISNRKLGNQYSVEHHNYVASQSNSVDRAHEISKNIIANKIGNNQMAYKQNSMSGYSENK